MKYRTKRKECRMKLRFYTILLCILMVSVPLLVSGGDVGPSISDGDIFSTKYLYKSIGEILIAIVAFFLGRTLIKVDKNQTNLYSNQRELAKVLTQLTTAHSINHNQTIDPPKLSGGEE